MPIDFRNLGYVYDKKSPFSHEAIRDISLHLDEGKFIAIVGKTGCGKSTLIQQLNALLTPTSGEVQINEFCNSSEKKKRTKKYKELRKLVGLVFQFPEYQLFDDTVEKDVSFGPKNFGLKKEQAIEEAHKALNKVGLDESFYDRSPFELSGGEKRKVAIAGILAIHPSYLVVDEPTAGLDPRASKDMMQMFQSINKEGTTIILVTHDMNLVQEFATDVIVMDEGRVAEVTTPVELFSKDLEHYSLEKPLIFKTASKLNASKKYNIDESKLRNVDDLAKAIAEGRK